MRKRISAFVRLFIHNNEEYPAPLSGQVIPWLSVSRARKKSPVQMNDTGQNWKPVSKPSCLTLSDNKQPDQKSLKLPRLDSQLKKSRLRIILEKNKYSKGIKERQTGGDLGNIFAQGKQVVILRHKTKIL